jgi:hypothetical protein
MAPCRRSRWAKRQQVQQPRAVSAITSEDAQAEDDARGIQTVASAAKPAIGLRDGEVVWPAAGRNERRGPSRWYTFLR